MRKIDKNCDLSTAYKQWEENLEQNNLPHPKYNSSKGKYYWDIVMQLFRCQNGLCAYTEQALCNPELFSEENWQDGSYKVQPPSQDGRTGELEHFDETLKSKKADIEGRKDWLWDNFFVVDATINERKGKKAIDPILKPDEEDYNPFDLLEYNVETHHYLPKKNLEKTTQERIRSMISVLGINQVNPKRKKELQRLFREYWLKGQQQFEVASEFPTAYEFCKNMLQEGKIDLKDLAQF